MLPLDRDQLLIGLKGAVAWLLSVWFNTFPPILHALFWIMLADQISGMIAAKEKLSSSKGFEGLKKKSLIWILIAVAHLSDSVVDLGFHFDKALALYFIINETLSVIENAAICGVPIPDWLSRRLEQVNSDEENNSDKNSGKNSDKKE